jgi:transcriptional regulator with XRE-family HTH domain
MTIGQFIKETRLRKGLTQEELAEKTDISVRTIQRIENGEVDPRSFTLQTIASVLEINFEEFSNYGKEESTVDQTQNDNLWIPLLHLSGLFVLVIPPVVIWLWQKDKSNKIKEHGIDVINFQISMFIYLVCAGLLVFLIIGLPIAIFLGFFSTIVIIVNTIKVIGNQPYKYPWTLKVLKHD